MFEALQELVERFPPPKKPRSTPVNWERVENHLGMSYPVSFKEFIDVYGGSVWFDNVSPIISQCKNEKQAAEFVEIIKGKIEQVNGDTYDENFNEIDVQFYPTSNGLFPFLIDYSGNMYLWARESDDPEEWPIILSHAGWMKTLGVMSIPEMILSWLKGEPSMKKVWGNVEEMPLDRLQITES